MKGERGIALFLSPERQQTVTAQALESKCLRSGYRSVAVWPWESCLTKNGDNSMTFPFGSPGRLEQGNSCAALGLEPCMCCSETVSKC